MAYYYNAGLRRDAGKLGAVFNIKNAPAAVVNTLVRDFEMSQAGAIEPNPWQTDGGIARIGLVGSESNLAWSRGAEGVTISLPERPPCNSACVYKIN